MKSSGLSDGVRRRRRILARSINSFTLVQIENIVDESIGMRCNDTIRCQRGCWEILQIDRYDQFSPG
jgi:hypothetical protein